MCNGAIYFVQVPASQSEEVTIRDGISNPGYKRHPLTAEDCERIAAAMQAKARELSGARR